MPQGNTRHRRISCAASSGQRTSISMREALSSTTSAQHGTDATRKMQHTTGAAACSDHTRSRQHAAGIETYEMRRTESGRSAPRERAGPSAVLRPGKDSEPQSASVVSYYLCDPALGDASDVAARRLRISLACVHRRPTDVDRLRSGIRTRLGARDAHAVGSCCPPRPRLPASRGRMKASGSFSHSALELRVMRRCLKCAATRVASCLYHACCRRATSRQARSA